MESCRFSTKQLDCPIKETCTVALWQGLHLFAQIGLQLNPANFYKSFWGGLPNNQAIATNVMWRLEGTPPPIIAKQKPRTAVAILSPLSDKPAKPLNKCNFYTKLRIQRSIETITFVVDNMKKQ